MEIDPSLIGSKIVFMKPYKERNILQGDVAKITDIDEDGFIYLRFNRNMIAELSDNNLLAFTFDDFSKSFIEYNENEDTLGFIISTAK